MSARRSMYWVLRADHTPVPTDDVVAWSRFFDPVRVSTVFLGLDHNWTDNGPPLLFESMVFGGPLDEQTYRYPTWDAALAGHRMLLDEAVIEGTVAAWEVRQHLTALSAKARELHHAAYREQVDALERARTATRKAEL